MKFNYLFIDFHNGYEKTYHPFCSNNILTQEKVTEWLNAIPGAGRVGTHLGHLLDELSHRNIAFEEFQCPCCDKIVHELKIFDSKRWANWPGIEWNILEGVSGNY
jgi:hypothetical protein